MSRFFRDVELLDIETIRNSFGEKYIFLETVSIETASPILKEIALNTISTLCLEYCKLLKIDSITDLRELVSYTDSTFDLNKKVQNPDFALIMFGLHYESSPNRLSFLYDRVKSDLKMRLEDFDLEASKTPVINELNSIEAAFQAGMKLLVRDAINRSSDDPENSQGSKLKLFVLLGFILVVILMVGMFFNKK